MLPSTRLRWRRRFRSFAALLLLAAMALMAWGWLPPSAESLPLLHVIDGDSVTVRRGGGALTVRLTGLDAPEYRQDCGLADGSRWACGREARAALERMARRGPLHCALAAKDKYRRTLGSCRTAPDPDGVDLSTEMIRQGWAVATDDSYLAEEGAAQRARRGIWQGDHDRPADWRAAHARVVHAVGDVAADR